MRRSNRSQHIDGIIEEIERQGGVVSRIERRNHHL